MDALDLQRLHKRLEARAELAGGAGVIGPVDRQHRPAHLLVHDMADERALEAPVIAELHLLVDDAVGTELAGKTIRRRAALGDLIVGNVARALGDLHTVAADLRERVLLVVQLDDLASRRGAEAVAVGYDECADLLDHLRQAGIVDLAADDGNAGAVPRLFIHLALFDLGERFAQLRQDEILRAAIGHKVEHVELVARDGRVVLLAQLADLGDDAADLVVLLHRLADGRVRGVDPVALFHHVKQPDAHLLDILADGVILHLKGHVGVRDKKVGLFVELEYLKVLVEAVHHRAGVHTGETVEEVVAALHAALEQGAGELAGVVRHVVGRHVDRTGPRRAQAHGETVVQIEQYLGNVEAGIADGELALRLCLLYQFVVRFVEELFKVDQMLEILQMVHLFSYCFFLCLRGRCRRLRALSLRALATPL